jgi:glycosyltransferase involved in cell wall biosynthesis
VLRGLFRRAERLIAVSDFEARLFRRVLALPESKFSVIPNGADIASDAADVDVAAEDDRIVSIGRLEKYKGHHRVLKALPYLLRERPNATLTLLGAGPYETSLRRLAARLGCSERVQIRSLPATERRATARVIKSAALVTVLSEYEAQGIAALEAAFLGRPLLVANSSALQELVHAGIARGISLHARPDEVARVMHTQLTDPLIPARRTLPTWEHCAASLASMYATILEDRRMPTRGGGVA